MKKLFYTAAVIGAFALTSTAAVAEHHEDGKHQKGDYVGKMMERVDTNNDGQISKAEFMAKHEEAFAKMDADGNGTLSTEELSSAKAEMKEKWKEMKEKREEKVAE